MAVGRISGPLLKSNLIRNGIDLAFETDLLYLDVNNQRIGVKKSNPEYEIDINGTTRTTDLIVTNEADIADINISGNTISTTKQYLNLATLDTVVSLNRLRVDSIDVEGNTISTNDSNANLELRPNGSGSVQIHSNLNVDGNIHATGNITADGNVIIGDADTDSITINAEIASDIIPNDTDTYNLGELGKSWKDVWATNLYASNVDSQDLIVEGIDLTLRHGNIFYVAENGDDTKTGTHYQDPFASIKHALSQATSGDTVHISPGVFTEEFPLTVPQGVSIKGTGIRSVKIVPTTETRYNDTFLLNGETTIEDLTVADFFSGGNFFEVNSASAGSTTVNVGITDKAHTYVSGGTINIGGIDYSITGATYTHTTGVLVLTHSGGTATIGNNVFLSGLTFSCNGDTRVFPDNGYAFRFATDFEVNSRSPYIKNVSVITQGSTTSVNDPRGFDTGDAGKGAYVDGAYATANSKEAAMLFHSVTFITPGVDGLTATNGARIEWLNSFTYFANRSMYAFDSNDGIYGNGKTRIKLGGVSGTFAAGDTVEFTSTDSSTVINVSVDDVSGNTLIVDGKNTDLLGFDFTPQSIVATVGSGATATSIENYDLMDFGAEVRLIASASVYGNYGLVGDGSGVLMYAIGHNMAYIGVGKEFTNEAEAIIQDNEVIETNDAKIRYNTVDQDGDFRVGDLFFVDQQTGNISFNAANFTINTAGGLTITDGSNTTFIDATKIDTGNLRISGNTVSSLSGDINLSPSNQELNLNGDVNVAGNLDVTGNVTIGGNITIGDEATDTIQIVAGIDSDIIPSTTSTYSLGTTSLRWKNLYINQINADDIEIRDNYITTTASNSDLELRANGTGDVLVPSNNVQIDNDLNVDGTTNLSTTNVSGLLTVTGNVNLSGELDLAGSLVVDQTLTVSGAAQFEEILVDDNYITTTTSNANLELRANGTGNILVPNNDVEITNDLTVVGEITANTLTTTGSITAISFSTGDILVDDNYITTTQSNSNLELRANGTGEILIPNNDVNITQNLTVEGLTTLADTTITGTIIHVGNTTQTGNFEIAGEITNGNILIEDNFITTTDSNSDLELRANGTGEILIPNNDVQINNNLTVSGDTDLQDTAITGTLTHIGDTTQTGNYSITGSFTNGNIQIDSNTIETTLSNSDLELRANGSGTINIPTNDVIFGQALTVSGNTDLQDTTITGTITHTGNLVQTGNFEIAGEITNGNILIEDNFIATTNSNSDLELRANGTGEILIPNNDVRITNNLFVNGDATLGDTSLSGTINITGDITQSGDYTITSDVSVGGDLTVTRSAQFEEILVDDNFITTTTSNADLELRANGTGEILIPNNDVHIVNDLAVDGTITVGDINSAGTITANRFSTGDILIDDNFITTTTSDSDLELRANGTGEILIPTNDVLIEQDLTVNGTATLSNTTVNGDITQTGNTEITGNIDISKNASISGTITVSSTAQFEDIQIAGNVITTTLSNSDLELRANGSGIINIPNNDVVIENNLDVNGTFTVGNIVSTGTIEANRFSTGDILVDDNYITTTNSNSDLELRAAGTGSIIIDTFTINNSTITSTGDFTITPGSERVVIDSTGAIALPVGNDAQRPTAQAGQIRFNNESARFEGYNGTNWLSLSGLSDLDGDTKITAELTEGANDNIIRFYSQGELVADLDTSRLNTKRLTVDDIEIDGNVISTVTTNTDLTFYANGTGSVVFENFAFKDNRITNTVPNSNTTFSTTGTGYVEFTDPYGVVLPVGNNATRPTGVQGMVRYNTEDSRVELYDGTSWVSVAGSSGGISFADAENIAIEKVLIFG